MRDEQYEVFISHAGEDKGTIAIPLRAKLATCGIRAFVDEKDLRLGENAPEQMTRAMNTASVGVFILSPEFPAKKWPMKELLCFLQRRAEAIEHGTTPPLLIPMFYRLNESDCSGGSFFGHRREEDGENVFVHWGFFERVRKGETEARKVIDALESVTELVGVRNEDSVTNEQSSEMSQKRKKLLDRTCTRITCEVHQRLRQRTAVQERSLAPSPERPVGDDQTQPYLERHSVGTRGSRFIVTIALLFLIAMLTLTVCNALARKRQDLMQANVRIAEEQLLADQTLELQDVNSPSHRRSHVVGNVHIASKGGNALDKQEVKKDIDIDDIAVLEPSLEEAPKVKRGHKRAASLLDQAIAEGHVADGLYRLGGMLTQKRGATQANRLLASVLYNRAIARGYDVSATIALAMLQSDGVVEGLETKRRRAIALRDHLIKQGDHLRTMTGPGMLLKSKEPNEKRDLMRAVPPDHNKMLVGRGDASIVDRRLSSLPVHLGNKAPKADVDSARVRFPKQEIVPDDRESRRTQNTGMLLVHAGQCVERDVDRTFAAVKKKACDRYTLSQPEKRAMTVKNDTLKWMAKLFSIVVVFCWPKGRDPRRDSDARVAILLGLAFCWWPRATAIVTFSCSVLFGIMAFCLMIAVYLVLFCMIAVPVGVLGSAVSAAAHKPANAKRRGASI